MSVLVVVVVVVVEVRPEERVSCIPECTYL